MIDILARVVCYFVGHDREFKLGSALDTYTDTAHPALAERCARCNYTALHILYKKDEHPNDLIPDGDAEGVSLKRLH